MERAVVRMYFEDGSFKTFLLVPTTTAKELCEQVRTKLRTNCAYYLFATAPGQGKIMQVDFIIFAHDFVPLVQNPSSSQKMRSLGPCINSTQRSVNLYSV